MKKAYFLLIFLTILSVIWVILPFDKKKQKKLQAVSHPQEYMTNVSMWSYTETGALKNELRAKYWAYLPETKSSELLLPHLTIYKPDKTIWHIDAKQGKVAQPTIGSIEQVELSNEVVIERPETDNHVIPLKLETSLLRYQPKTQYAETEQWITMTKPGLKIQGLGMRAFLDKNFVELLKDVKTTYIATHH